MHLTELANNSFMYICCFPTMQFILFRSNLTIGMTLLAQFCFINRNVNCRISPRLLFVNENMFGVLLLKCIKIYFIFSCICPFIYRRIDCVDNMRWNDYWRLCCNQEEAIAPGLYKDVTGGDDSACFHQYYRVLSELWQCSDCGI